jgi:hypothetical protein
MRVMISGAIASHPLYSAGNSWAFLQYVLGFRKLGIETYYVEQLNPEDCVDEAWNRAEFMQSANASYFRALMERFDLTGRVSLLESGGAGHVGLSRGEIEAIAPEIDLLINGSGRLHINSILTSVRRRMYLDLDPGYTQVWQERYGVDMNLRDHDLYVTVGLNLGAPQCPFPTCGIPWEKTLPPVVLEEWTTNQPPGDAYSTVADWRSFYPIEWNGVWYNQKADAFKSIIELPRRVRVPLELCLSIDAAERDWLELERHGWQLTPPGVHAASIDAYRNYVVGSRGEFSAVKQGYAVGRTGWFSDRSACYLAAGRPVIVQDTGIGTYLPTGMGLLIFKGIEDAAAALEAVESDYARHACAATDIAREFLDAAVVLPRLLEFAGI